MKLLITGAWRHTPDQIAELESMGYDPVFMPDERGELPCDPSEVECAVANGLFLYHPMEVFTSLRFVQLTSAGLDRVPVAYARERGITLCNARGVYSVPMAEFALAAVLSVYKETDHFTDARRDCRWDKHRGLRELFGKTVCIVGCGSVGGECAKRFSAMGCAVVGVDVFPREDALYARMEPVSRLHDLLPVSDLVVLTLPLTPETHHLFDREALALLPDGCVLVNIARGGVVDTEALIEALRTRPLTAVLDVFESEPLPSDSPLWSLPNAVLTPHNSFVGEGNGQRLWAVIRENLLGAAETETHGSHTVTIS